MENENQSNFLARFFFYVHDVVRAADEPIYLVIVVLLPLIAPVIPATITANSLTEFMDFAKWEAVLSGVVLAMIGYAGVISTVASLSKATKEKSRENWVEFAFFASAWIIYLISLIVVNYTLEKQAGATSARLTVIISLTVGLEFAAGVLNAKRIQSRDEMQIDEKRYQEKREDAKWRYAMKHGAKQITQMAADVSGVTGVSGAKDTPLSDKDKRQIDRFRNDLSVTGNWRIDGKKMNKSDLEWLARAETSVIKLAIGGENTPDKTAQNWRNYARQKLSKK
jgi:hypothetical protein